MAVDEKLVVNTFNGGLKGYLNLDILSFPESEIKHTTTNCKDYADGSYHVVHNNHRK